MRDSLFNILIAELKTLTKFIGADGTVRVYDYPITAPAGYPYVTVVSETMTSNYFDTARDLRTYGFFLSIVGEKFGDESGLSQADALATMRATEDDVVALIDGLNRLGAPGEGLGVIRTLPTNSKYGYTDGNSRVVLEITVQVQVPASITS